MNYQELKALFEELGHVFFDKGAYNLNLYGIRNGYGSVNEFNDVLGVAYRDEQGNEIVLEHKGTTDPGSWWLRNRMGNPNGTFILAPGQYRDCWSIGKHKGYEALVQVGSPFKGWRDNDQDGQLDPEGKLYRDVTGLNMHTTSWLKQVDKVGAYSAGCQVRQYTEAHEHIMKLCRKSADFYGNSFSYTLIEKRC